MSVKRADPKAFATDQEVRWCPGCGDYAVLKAVRQTLADCNAETHRTVFVSGIGCAARFPYYMNTFGIHTIHGRAPAIATGLKSVQPGLDVWVITGDGDGLSIGANHLYHTLRRNVDLQILLFNNQIYGLTKGQASPTSRTGLRTPSTPEGVTANPAEPCRFALGAGARFIARSIDVHQPHLRDVLRAAREFRGTAIVEILQNCPIYNDNAFGHLTDKSTSADRILHLEHGRPLVFGAKNDKGIRLQPGSLRPEIVEIDPERPSDAQGLLVHDESDPALAALLATFEWPDFPVALGVIHRADMAVFAPARGSGSPADSDMAGRLASVDNLLRRAKTWVVE